MSDPDFTFTAFVAETLKLVSAVSAITLLVLVAGAFMGAL